MNTGEARLRLGVGEDASPQDVLAAHHRIATHGARLPPEARREFLRGLDQARDVLLGHSTHGPSRVLDPLATPRGMAALTAVGVVLAALSLFANAKLSLLSVLAPFALGLSLVLSAMRRRIYASMLLALAFLVSGAAVVRRLSDPGTHSFF